MYLKYDFRKDTYVSFDVRGFGDGAVCIVIYEKPLILTISPAGNKSAMRFKDNINWAGSFSIDHATTMQYLHILYLVRRRLVGVGGESVSDIIIYYKLTSRS